MIELSYEQFPQALQEIKPMLTEFVGFGGITVTTCHVSFGHARTEDVLDGKAKALSVTATSDGRGYVAEWHDGEPTSDDWVYVERYSERGREFHGWVDRLSRKIVQTG